MASIIIKIFAFLSFFIGIIVCFIAVIGDHSYGAPVSMTLIPGISAIISSIFLYGLAVIVRAAEIYIDKNENQNNNSQGNYDPYTKAGMESYADELYKRKLAESEKKPLDYNPLKYEIVDNEDNKDDTKN